MASNVKRGKRGSSGTSSNASTAAGGGPAEVSPSPSKLSKSSAGETLSTAKKKEVLSNGALTNGTF